MNRHRPTVSLVAVVARNGGIGRGNALLWRLPEDLRHFKRTTLGSPVIMGRKTWDSIGRPLPGRRNIVITHDPDWHHDGAEAAPSLESALERLEGVPKAFVIGGAQIYAQAIALADELVLTEVDADAEADTFFPPWDRDRYVAIRGEPHRSDQGFTYRFVTYQRKQGV
jgi:dihydrofolate reductase